MPADSLESEMPEARQDFESLYAGQFQLPAYPDQTIRMEIRRSRRSLLGDEPDRAARRAKVAQLKREVKDLLEFIRKA